MDTKEWMGKAAEHVLAWPGVERVILSFEPNGDPRVTLREGIISISRIFMAEEIWDWSRFDQHDLLPLLKQWENRRDYNHGYEKQRTDS